MMKRGRSTGNPTVPQQRRMDAIAEIGCIVAHSLGIDWGDRPIPSAPPTTLITPTTIRRSRWT